MKKKAEKQAKKADKIGDMSDYYYKKAYGVNVQHQAHKETHATYKTYGYDRAI